MKKIAYIILLTPCLLTSCSSRYASNGETQYLKSKNGPGMVIPAPLDSDSISHFYDLPQPSQSPTVSINPPSTITSVD